MATPESKVKNEVKKQLEKHKGYVNGFWPVPYGYGESHLDWVGCAYGFFVAIEVKAPGKKPTPRQKHRIEGVKVACGIALVVDGTDATTTYAELGDVLDGLHARFRRGE